MNAFFAQFPALIRLALPVSIGQLGYMTMALVDIAMVGSLGAAALGGVGIGSNVFMAIISFFMGTLLGIDGLAPVAYGRKDLRETHYWLVQSVYLTLALAAPCLLFMILSDPVLPWFGVAPEVEVEARRYLRVMAWGGPPFLLFVAFRQYLQAMNSVKVTTGIVVIANFVNWGLNYVFIFGHLGSPVMGVAGSALATVVTRVLMCLSIVGYTFYRDRRLETRLSQVSWKLEVTGMKKIFSIGAPAGLQWSFEVVVFSLSTILAGRISAVAVAAHTIVLNVVSVAYMVVMAIGSAAATRVGQEIGRGEKDQATLSGWAAISLAGFFMFLCALGFMSTPAPIVSWFSTDAEVLSLAVVLLWFAALFQIADGLQTAGTGALRGLSDTRFPMLANFGGHWLIGLPVGYYFCFYGGKGVVGLWWGLTTGLWLASLLVVARWKAISPAS